MNTEIKEMPSFLVRNTQEGEAQIAYLSHAFKKTLDQENLSVLFCGGFNSNMRGSKAEFLKEHCQKAGQNYYRFDYQGHGESSGQFSEGTIGQWYGDALFFLDEVCKEPLVLVGSSMGGWMSLLLARARPEIVKGLVLIAPAPDFPQKLMWSAMDNDIRSELEMNGVWYRPSEFEGEDSYPITKNLIDESKSHHLLDGEMIEFDGPVHILHGSEDEVVPTSHAFKVSEALKSKEVTIEIIKGGDHRLSMDSDLLCLGRRLQEVCDKVKGLNF